jgi:hypothetical protein
MATEVAVMSLSAREQQALDGIENRLVGSDPQLAGLLATFTRMTLDEGMPACEEVRIQVPWPCHLFRRVHQPPTASVGLGGVMALLWVLIAVSMIAVAVTLSGGGSGGVCVRSRAAVGATPVACAAQAPARSSRPLAPPAS